MGTVYKAFSGQTVVQAIRRAVHRCPVRVEAVAMAAETIDLIVQDTGYKTVDGLLGTVNQINGLRVLVDDQLQLGEYMIYNGLHY